MALAPRYMEFVDQRASSAVDYVMLVDMQCRSRLARSRCESVEVNSLLSSALFVIEILSAEKKNSTYDISAD